MIRTLTVKNFKRFASESFELEDSVVLAGPNNAGKSTLLQAIATWKFGLDHWIARRSGTRASRRSGVPITRSEFTPVPLREMNLLWEGRRVAPMTTEPGSTRFIEILVEGDEKGTPWSCGLEFQYANPEMVYVRPLDAKQLSKDAFSQFPPQEARELEVLHVPALSGIERDEPRRDRGMQDLLIGQGRSGEILRNLLLEVSQREGPDWDEIASLVHSLFGIALDRPAYNASMPFIISEYREGQSRTPLDLSSAGSGTLQVLLLLAFIYSRPASVILLDEPDAHQHIILQRQLHADLLKIARKRRAQVLIGTHSEILLNATEPSRVYGFLGGSPRILATETDRDRVREALKRLSTTDLLLGREVGAVLYVEGPTDELILKEWARSLGHPAAAFFERPFVIRLGGRSLSEAKAHFFAMRAAVPDLRGVCLLDGDNPDGPDVETKAGGPVVVRWLRYEIENYLLQPGAIKRVANAPLFESAVDSAFRKHLPRGTNLFSDHVALTRIKASEEFLVPLLRQLGANISKRDLYLIAAEMESSEIHPEVKVKLDMIATHLLPISEEG